MNRVIILCCILLGASHCKKDRPGGTPPIDDARTVLIKEVIAQDLPNPYWSFVYDDRGYVTQVHSASGENIYNIEYENLRVKKMVNSKNGRVCRYGYTGKHVTEINEFDGATGKKLFSYRLTYNEQDLLSRILWVEFPNDQTETVYKKALLSYYPHGNLSVLEHYSISATGELNPGFRFQYSDYDTGINVDDFYLVEDYFDTFLFLPQVKLQKNNPSRGKIIGRTSEFDVTYNYQYNDKHLPVSRIETMLQTRGPDPGNSESYTHQFTYY